MITKEPVEPLSLRDIEVASALVADRANPIERQTKVQAEAVDFYYGEFQALKGISLTVAQNEILALIGPSGCGKSTFLRSLNRMNDLIAGSKLKGRILIDGQDIYSREVDPVELRRQVGMVFQKPNPFPKSIFDNVAYGPRIHGVKDKQRLEEIVEHSLRQAALWDEVKDKLKQSALALSGGQQQRLCIARTLAVEPDIILMDEPCSALDPHSTARIEELMIGLAERYTILIVTHNMQQAARVSSRTGFFLKGELVEIADTKLIFNSPKDQRTLDYVSGKFG